jgi:hypothetical protein
MMHEFEVPNLRFGAGPATSRSPWSYLCKLVESAYEFKAQNCAACLWREQIRSANRQRRTSQFYNNTGRQSAFLHTVRSGLEACGAQPYLQIFDEFCALVDSRTL